ncbi:MAG: nucleotidyltransferase family protein [Actinomycetota bacterium]|nr:nucleotidyltransferase family protein [Actinomycetota bacterium]
MQALGNLMKVDAVTAEVVTHLRGLGIRTILLKGPSFGRWLYDRTTDRLYADTDLLVAPRDADALRAAMRDLGFEVAVPRHELDRPVPAVNWVRDRTGSAVDVHVGITGAGIAFEEQWEVLSQGTETMRVGGAEVEVLSPAARALHLVLHGVQHGRGGRPPDDLQRALERLPEETWHAAAALAVRLDATAAFAAGLRLHDDGARLAERLGLPAARSVEVILREEQAPLALGLKWLTEMPGTRARLRLVRSKVFPPAASLIPPGQPRTRRVLAAAYVRNFWRMTRLALPAWRALRRARRQAASGTSVLPPDEMDEPS